MARSPRRPKVDTLWYLDRAKLRPSAKAIAQAAEEYLLSERKGLNVPEPEVEEAARAIPGDAPTELQTWVAGRMTAPLSGSPITFRHIAAQNCHRYERAQFKDRRLDARRTQTVKVKDENPINAWIRALPDALAMALIRENPLWLRNPALADRVCRWRVDMLNGDDSARSYLEQLASPYVVTVKGRPAIGPRYSNAELRRAVLVAESQRRDERKAWVSVRSEADATVALLELGGRFWQRVHGWDTDDVKAWAHKRKWSPPELTPDQTVMHLARYLVILRDASEASWVTIDDDGWPRAAAVAFLAARWKVSKGWILKRLRPEK